MVGIFRILIYPLENPITSLSFIPASTIDLILTVFYFAAPAKCSLFRPLHLVHACPFLHLLEYPTRYLYHLFSYCCITTPCNPLVSIYNSHNVVRPILQSQKIVGHYSLIDSQKRHVQDYLIGLSSSTTMKSNIMVF